MHVIFHPPSIKFFWEYPSEIYNSLVLGTCCNWVIEICIHIVTSIACDCMRSEQCVDNYQTYCQCMDLTLVVGIQSNHCFNTIAILLPVSFLHQTSYLAVRFNIRYLIPPSYPARLPIQLHWVKPLFHSFPSIYDYSPLCFQYNIYN